MIAMPIRLIYLLATVGTILGANACSGGDLSIVKPATAPMAEGATQPNTPVNSRPTGSSSPAPTPTPTPTPTPATVDPNTPSIPVHGPSPSVQGYGAVTLQASQQTTVVDFTTTLTVPPAPGSNNGTLFLWPGLQPGGANYDPIDNGVLQPVLTWGNSCAPGQQPTPYSTWWVSSQYVNTYGHDPNYMGCYGGNIMSVAVGDQLLMHFYIEGSVWVQDVTDVQTGKKVTFSIDMQMQAQNLIEFIIESYGPEPMTDVVFTDTTITFANPTASSCWPIARGPTDYVSPPSTSPNGLHCAIDEIVLRAQNVPVSALTPPGP